MYDCCEKNFQNTDLLARLRQIFAREHKEKAQFDNKILVQNELERNVFGGGERGAPKKRRELITLDFALVVSLIGLSATQSGGFLFYREIVRLVEEGVFRFFEGLDSFLEREDLKVLQDYSYLLRPQNFPSLGYLQQLTKKVSHSLELNLEAQEGEQNLAHCMEFVRILGLESHWEVYLYLLIGQLGKNSFWEREQNVVSCFLVLLRMFYGLND